MATNTHTLDATQRRFMLAALFLCNILASIGQSMVNVALDDVSTHFDVELSIANWMVLGFSIVAGATIMSAASILARIGLRKSIFIGLACALAGSILGFAAWNFEAMFAARILQAVTSGLFFPIISAAILWIAPEGKSATLLSLNSALIGLGLALSPALSGIMITRIGLNAIFLVTGVLSIASFAAAFFAVREVRPHSHRNIDGPSMLLAFIGMFTFFFGLNRLMKDPLVAVAFMAAGAVVIAIFAKRQSRLETPLLDLSALRDASFDVGEAIAMACYLGSLFMSLLVPMYLEGTGGMSTFEAGIVLAVPICMYVVSTYIGGRIEDKRGVWPLLPVGALILCAGLVGMWFMADGLVIVGLVVFSGVAYFGVGLVYAPTKSRDLEDVPKDSVASASSLHSTLAQVANSVGSAIFVGVMSSDVSAAMAEHMSKADAYAAGFSHTLLIEIGIAVVALVVGVFFARKMHKRFKARG